MIDSAKYAGEENTTVCVVWEGSPQKYYVPVDESNRHYAELMVWVAAGNTIEAF